MPVSTEDFTFLADFVRDRSAISIGPGKEYLVESRLMPVAREVGLDDLAALVGELRRPFPNPAVKEKVIEAMTTNETSFFRDHSPFDALRTKVVPDVLELKATTRKLRIWSAASSTGQELYSIAMLLDSQFPQLSTWDVTLHGTDLSNEVLAKARSGRFSALEVNRGLPAPLLVKYFKREGADYVISDIIKQKATFERINLAEVWPIMPVFDVVFCRNVLIYFELDVRRQILEKIRKNLTPGGYLFLGSSESTVGLVDGFTAVRVDNTVVYRKEA
ncbi:MAG: CheR family methyltransferase [Jatrophihabitans sp.]|uniref:CheR family methyltransferase n=1 Tax=Jatrophihabitans sp. TaxID=1932789 RepID=UPI003F7EE8F7